MKKYCLTLLCILVVALTPSTAFIPSSEMDDFAADLYEIFKPAFAAYKIDSYLGSSPFTPSPKNCWICGLIMTTMEKYVDLNNMKIDDFLMNKLCPRFPLLYRPLCIEFVNTYGPTIINSLVETESPDAACRAINMCNMPQCNLIPKGMEPKVSFSPDWVQYFQFQPAKIEVPEGGWLDFIYKKLLIQAMSRSENSTLTNFVQTLGSVGVDPFDWLKKLIDRIANNHTAISDIDGDFFSKASAELRGYNWRGRDCADDDAKVYPGRKTNAYPGFEGDYNCNGIKGIDPNTKRPYKDLFCENSGQIGVVVMGDSAGAHAEAPQQWVNASAWSTYTFDDLLTCLADEIDLPHMSAYTGYAETGYTGPVSSVYKYLYERNKCNFRDYQNIAVNGLNSNNAHDSLIRIARSQTDDYPVLVFLELVGNDVCGSEETYSHWTTPERFRTNLIGILDTIDSLVPPGSHLVAVGLANGSLIFEGVNGKMHPVGVTYNQLYDFQNCLGASMCWGWLNTNQTIRDATTQRAMELSQVYSQVFSNYTAKNFDMAYYDFPTQSIWDSWVAAGNDPYYLIEPTDGFHPNQNFNALLGDHLWKTLLQDHPDWLGPVNPNNDLITQLFGDQGGY